MIRLRSSRSLRSHPAMRAAELSIVRLSMPLIPHTQAAAEASDYVIIHEANRLHEGVADLWAHESKAALD